VLGYQGPDSARACEDWRHVVIRFGAEPNRSAGLQVKIDIALKVNRSADKPVAGRHYHPAAACFMTGRDGPRNRRPAIGLAVANRSEVSDAENTIRKLRRLNSREYFRYHLPTRYSVGRDN
jgi:hypothetical protein